MINILLENAKRPSIYTKAYFQAFLSKENYKDFEINPKINKHRVTSTDKEPLLFKLYSYASEYKGDTEDIKYIRIETNHEHTCKQILWIILNTYYKIYLEAEKNPEILEKYRFAKFGATISELLYYAALTFINRMRGIIMHYTSTDIEDTDFLLIYCSIIRERMVGNSLSKVLYITNRWKNAPPEQIYVKNIQFMPLCQREIEEISFLLGDENSNQLILKSNSTPTALTLHFRKKV